MARDTPERTAAVRETIRDVIDGETIDEALAEAAGEEPHEDAAAALTEVVADEAAKQARWRNRAVTPEDIARAAERRRGYQRRMRRHYGP
ncbi:hypothetical protein BRC83_09035 [Halobacteriales archaeon QS_1_68_17]|nr:MAG: hypothetical protein BRC83_09035 [Halobacteriales archaeon QS_1_68_17]